MRFHHLLIHACLGAILFFIENSSAQKQCSPSFNNDHDCLLFDQRPSRVLRAKENREKNVAQDRKPRHRPNRKTPDDDVLQGSQAAPMNELSDVEFQNDGEVTRVSRNAQSMNQIEAYFADGMLDSSFDRLVVRDINPMIGSWRLVPEISESTDDIFQALGVSPLKRSLMRDYQSLTEIGRPTGDKRPAVSLTTHLPLSIVKRATVYVDGNIFQLSDSDTGTWNAVAVIYNGVLLQKRASTTGTMYDVRATIQHHPDNPEYSPMHLFKWTFIDNRGRKHVAHRYFKKA